MVLTAQMLADLAEHAAEAAVERDGTRRFVFESAPPVAAYDAILREARLGSATAERTVWLAPRLRAIITASQGHIELSIYRRPEAYFAAEARAVATPTLAR
ncbi:MAG: hypothetical protein K6W08_14690 [Firmicutes bacterium]|nr:hypothetical protein [Bacillota bacterium]